MSDAADLQTSYSPVDDPQRIEYYKARNLPIPQWLLERLGMVPTKAAPAPTPTPAVAAPAVGNPWDPVIARLKKQFPNASAGELWKKYNTGDYTSAPGDPPNPFVPKMYVPPTKTGAPNFAGAPPLDQRNADPYALAYRNALDEQALGTAKVIPGATPDLAVLPDGTIISLITRRPVDPTKIDPTTQAFAKLAARAPKVPLVKDTDRLGSRLTNRGYVYRGAQSDEERKLEQLFLAGNVNAAPRLAQLRMSRLQEKERPLIDKVMRPLDLALMAIGIGAATGGFGDYVFGPGITSGFLSGAAGSGITNMLATHGDLNSTLAATLAGGAAGGAAAGLPQGGGFVGGALRGGASAGAGTATRLGVTKLLGGDVNPWDLLREVISGAVSGGISGGTTGSDPGGIGNFDIGPTGIDRLTSIAARQAAGRILGDALPQGRTGFAPPDVKMPDVGADVQALRDQQLADFQASAQEYLDRYNAAMGARNEKVAEYNARLAEARERLRKQALAYLEQVKSAQTAPLPPIPVQQAPPPPPKPDDFDPSAMLAQETFSSEGLPVSRGASNTEFPVSQPSGTTASTTPTVGRRPPTSSTRLPLNLLQILAAARSQRRG